MLSSKRESLTLVNLKEFLINIIIQYYTTPVGDLILGTYDNEVCLCDWRYRKQREAVDQRIQNSLNATYEEGHSPIMDNLKKQLEEYFNGTRQSFDIPLKFCGTDFQQRVWKELLKIPFGKTLSYLDLSLQLGDKKAIRAVAAANGANAISILVPCHRIIGSNGELTGYAGGLSAKKKLLQLEGSSTQMNLF